MMLKKTLIARWIHLPEHWYTVSFTKLCFERMCWSDAVTLDRYKWYLAELSKPNLCLSNLCKAYDVILIQHRLWHIVISCVHYKSCFVHEVSFIITCWRRPCRETLRDRTSGNNQTSGRNHVGTLCWRPMGRTDDRLSTRNVGKWEVCSERKEHVGLKSTLLKCSSVKFTIWCNSSSNCDLIENLRRSNHSHTQKAVWVPRQRQTRFNGLVPIRKLLKLTTTEGLCGVRDESSASALSAL